MEDSGQVDQLEQNRHIPPNAGPRTGGEGDPDCIHSLQSIIALDQPTFGLERLRIWKNLRVAMGRIRGDGDDRIARNRFVIDGVPFRWRLAVEVGGDWGRKVHGFVDTGSEVVEALWL